AAALFGTFTPYAALKLTALTGDKASPGFWLMCAAASGFMAAVAIYRSGAIEAREKAVASQHA
ncbi:MAG TPA: citrate-proton symporter, partial [Bradyrhizobium sp.]|nr:citrate-proton symporter [Bradyrhizobium sp.]